MSLNTDIDKVRQHPDCVWTTVFTWEDVGDQLEAMKDDSDYGHRLPSLDECKAARGEFKQRIERACMDGGDWTLAIQSVIEDLCDGAIEP